MDRDMMLKMATHPKFGNPDGEPNPNLDPIQNNCHYGWVLPYRCRYNPRLGCSCGAYPPLAWCEVCHKYVVEICPDAGVCSPDLRRP